MGDLANQAREQDHVLHFSNAQDEPTSWTSAPDFLHAILVPHKWWSFTAWRLAIGLRPYVRWSFVKTTPKIVDVFQARVQRSN